MRILWLLRRSLSGQRAGDDEDVVRVPHAAVVALEDCRFRDFLSAASATLR